MPTVFCDQSYRGFTCFSVLVSPAFCGSTSFIIEKWSLKQKMHMKLCQRKMKNTAQLMSFKWPEPQIFPHPFEISEPVKKVVRNMGICETLSPGGGRQGPRLGPSFSTVYTGTPDPSFFPELRGPSLLLAEPSAILQSCQPDHRAFFWQHSDIQGNISDIKLNMSLWAKLALWNFDKHGSNALISQPAQVQTKTPNTDKVFSTPSPKVPTLLSQLGRQGVRGLHAASGQQNCALCQFL